MTPATAEHPLEISVHDLTHRCDDGTAGTVTTLRSPETPAPSDDSAAITNARAPLARAYPANPKNGIAARTRRGIAMGRTRRAS